jgi:hypothetical protein
MGSVAMIVLGIWLVFSGLAKVTSIGVLGNSQFLAIMAIIAGLLILTTLWPFANIHGIGMVLLSVWLIAQGAVQIFHLSFPASATILALIGIVSGVLMLFR